MELLVNILFGISRLAASVLTFQWLYRREIDQTLAQSRPRREGRRRARQLRRSREAAARRRRAVNG